MANAENTLPEWANDRVHFYKYMSRHTGRIVLENTTLRWSTPGTLNDPYDAQFDLNVEIDRVAVRRATLDKLWDAHYGDHPESVGNRLGAVIRMFRGHFPQFTREEFDRQFGEAVDEGLERGARALPEVQADVRAIMARSKLLCLTEVPDSSPMWAYYAEAHQGIVLSFRSVPELDSPWPMARPINYVAHMPRLLDEDFLSDMMSGRISIDVESVTNRMIYTKSEEWAHEREWRIFTGDGRNAEAPYEDIPFHGLELDAVILGVRMPENDKAEFSDLVRRLYSHASILQIKRSADEFRLEIENFRE